MFGMVNFGAIVTVVKTEQQEFTTEYKKLLTWTADGPNTAPVTLDCGNGSITLTETGNYNLRFTISFKGTNERDYSIALFQDGIINNSIKAERYFGPNLVTGDMYIGGILEITSVPTKLDIRVKCNKDKANVMIVENALLSLVEIIPDSATDDISCKVTKSADQTITNSTSTIITWDNEDYDTDSMHDNITNNSRITIKTPGKYSVMAQYEWTSNSSGKRIIDIMKNNTAVGKANYLASGNSQHTISFIGEFLVNDILEVRVFQDSGGNLDFLDNITYFEAHLIH